MMTPRFVGPYCIKQRRLAKIWRAIARRRMTIIRQIEVWPGYRVADNDGETDP